MFLRPPRALGLAAAIALAVPALAAVPGATAAPDQQPARAAETSALTLWAPKQLTTYSYGNNRTWTDLGLRVIAEGAAFELWSHRPSYDDQIETVWRKPDGDVPLAIGSMDTFSGLNDFLTLEIDPAGPGATKVLTRKACLNGYSERVRPDAPARSPYPVGCWYNAYSVGSVQGVQQGWATPILTQDRPFRIGPGKYTVTARITSGYAATFGLTEEQATRVVKLTVLDEGDGGVGVGPETPHGHRGTSYRPAAEAPTGPSRRAEDGPMPDLRSLPAWGINVAGNGNYLRFSATVWNAGNSPLVVDGFRHEDEDEMTAYQYFFDGEGNQTGYEEVGHMHWDPKPSHQHWHFEDFARYSLLNEDMEEAVRSRKEAFCLANTDSVDLTVPDAEWKPENTDLSTSCGDYSSLSIREVLAAGWGDTYTQYRAGQSFDLRGLPNGTYYVAVIANPENRLVESSLDNNVELREIHLKGKPGARKVVVEQVGIIEEEQYGGTG